jgi:hypothetical protein
MIERNRVAAPASADARFGNLVSPIWSPGPLSIIWCSVCGWLGGDGREYSAFSLYSCMLEVDALLSRNPTFRALDTSS